MKVLHIATAFPPDGNSAITPWLAQLLKAQRRLGADVQVLTSAYRGLGDGVVHGIPVWRFRYSPASLESLTHETAIYEKLRLSPARYLQVPLFLLGGMLKARSLRRLRPEVVHVHWPIPLALLARPFRDAKIVFQYHQTELSLVEKFPLLKAGFAPAVRRARIHLCNSSFTRQRLQDVFGVRNAEVVPMPFAWDVPPSLPPKEPGRILFVGRMVHWKGGDILLEAARILKENGLACRLVLVGDGPERAAWTAAAARSGLDAQFTGWMIKDELMREYARATALVLPSRFDPKIWVESLGVVLLEAMACGTAVIASKVGGPLDVIREGENGLFFEPDNASDLAGQLRRLLGDQDLARRMGDAGRKRAAAFHPDAIALRLAQIYEAL